MMHDTKGAVIIKSGDAFSQKDAGSDTNYGGHGDACGECAKEWDGTSFLIRCDACLAWYHGSCVSVSHAASKLLSRFSCPQCPGEILPRLNPCARAVGR
eukprot:3396256-Rhodomonas_salina.1